MLEEERRRRREDAEKRLQDETFHRQQLVEREVKMRANNFAQDSEGEGVASGGRKSPELKLQVVGHSRIGGHFMSPI
ncbi:hypothetical protein CesoFtcFv8_007330 [Champsocephalus esox]|uniref:Uncharacterized protein n=1 Tax=Champsocephalus esox TaxID=159716 RepID=A0AAN8CEC9_9TELE|nr:hypothetical protein CesoFtcFv8_007330 [Champsocephalus esox]